MKFKKIIDDNFFICSAGTEYCFVNADNKIYKCVAQYIDCCKNKNHSFHELLNENYDLFFNKNNIKCMNPLCLNKNCDVYFINIWDKENKNLNIERKFDCKNISFSTINNIEELKENKNFLIHLSPVEGCVNLCPYCHSIKNKIKKINMEFLYKFIDYIYKNYIGIKKMNIAGTGEPLLHEDLNEKFFEYCHEKNISLIYLATSGLWNTSIFKKVEDLSNLELNISLHPLSPNWNLEKIIKLIEDLKQTNIKKIACRLVLYEKNLQFIDLFENIANKYNIAFDKLDYVKY